MTGEADLLAAIYAAPDDDAPRAVYADWLLERGDARGEFIALQLGHRSAPEREAALLAKYGDAWAGRLGAVLIKAERVFARGFLSGGTVRGKLAAADVEAASGWPEWALVEALDVGAVSDDAFRALAATPWFRRLRGLHGITAPKMQTVVSDGRNARLEDLSIQTITDLPRSLQLFPRLRQLRVRAAAALDPDTFQHPLPSTLERITIERPEPSLRDVVAAAPRGNRGGPALEVRASRGGSAGPSYELRVDEHGRYTRLRARPSSAEDFRQQLQHVYPATEVIVETTKAWSAEQVARVEASFAAQPQLRAIAVPWSRAAFVDPPFIALRFSGVENVAQRTNAILDLVTSPPMSLRFDTIKTSAGVERVTGNPRPLLKKLFTQSRGWNIDLYQAKTPRACRVWIDNVDLTLGLPRIERRELEAWLTRFVDEHQVGAFTAPFLVRSAAGRVETADPGNLRPLDEPFPWIRGFARDDPRFDGRELHEAAKPFPWIGAHETRRNVFFVFGDDPEAPPPREQREGFELALIAAFWRRFERVHGFEPVPLVHEILTPALVRRGCVPIAASAPEAAMGSVEYGRDEQRWPFRLRIEPNRTLTFKLGDLVDDGISTREAAETGLRRLAARLP